MDPLVDSLKELLALPVNAWIASCLGVGALAVVLAAAVPAGIARKEVGAEAMRRAGRAIHVGVRGFLRTHAAAVAATTLVGSTLLLLAFNRAGDAWTTALSFAVGCVGSTLAGALGLRAASVG